MLSKVYLFVGLSLCIGLGIAFATGWKAPDLGITSGSSSGGRAFFFHGGGGGFHFGK